LVVYDVYEIRYYYDECAKYIENLKAHMVTVHERMCL
jgi:hypothetical protein